MDDVPSHNGIPDSYWREVPCGHPPDPVALWNDSGDALCHCGNGLAKYDKPVAGYVLDGVPAPGPLVHCDGCGCHVAVPPFGAAAGKLAKRAVAGLPVDRVYEDAYAGPLEVGARDADYGQQHAWAMDTLRKEREGYMLVTMGNQKPKSDGRGGYDVDVAVAHWNALPYKEQVAWYTALQRVVQDAMDRLARYGETGEAQHGADNDVDKAG